MIDGTLFHILSLDRETMHKILHKVDELIQCYNGLRQESSYLLQTLINLSTQKIHVERLAQRRAKLQGDQRFGSINERLMNEIQKKIVGKTVEIWGNLEQMQLVVKDIILENGALYSIASRPETAAEVERVQEYILLQLTQLNHDSMLRRVQWTQIHDNEPTPEGLQALARLWTGECPNQEMEDLSSLMEVF